MPTVGRRRKNPDSGLERRVYVRRGKWHYYAHPDGRWEPLGEDREAANRKARVYNDPDGEHGTVVYWLKRFLMECELRVAGGTLSQRTLDDYRGAIETSTRKDGEQAVTGLLSLFFAAPMTPLDVTPNHIKRFLELGAQQKRAVRANRDKACFSSFFSWLITTGEVPGLVTNPCMRASGVKRNPESKRDRYVPHDEYRDVYAVASRAERVLMVLTYRSLQRPESDIIHWTTEQVVTQDGKRMLDFVQNKTGRRHRIALTGELEDLLPKPIGNVVRLREPLVKRLNGRKYTYGGLSSMLRRSIEVANVRRAARGQPPIASFGFRDLKGKGATDMYYLAKRPIEEIQQLLGHANKSTTEIYIKQRWRETAEPNMVEVG